MKRIILIIPMLLSVLFSNSIADQTDSRLDSLFVTLQSSDDANELLETESQIWEIWFDSGLAEVDRLMSQAAEYVQIGNLAYAEDLYTRVIDKVPEFSEGWNRRATVRYYLKDYEGSLDDIQRTLLLEPRHFGATWGLGMILGRQGNFTAAIAAFERLLELKPNARDARARIQQLKEELAKSSV